VNDVPAAVIANCELPFAALDVFVSVIVDEPLPGDATVCGLKLAVTPAGNPVTEKASDDLKPPSAAVVTLSVPLAVELTVMLVTFGVSENPGTFTATVCFWVTPPPVAVSVTE